MSDGIRNRDVHRLRALSTALRALSWPHPAPLTEAARNCRESELELRLEFDRIRAKYGFKSRVMDRRRRCSTRRGNARGQRIAVRAQKRSERDRLRAAIIRELSA